MIRKYAPSSSLSLSFITASLAIALLPACPGPAPKGEVPAAVEPAPGPTPPGSTPPAPTPPGPTIKPLPSVPVPDPVAPSAVFEQEDFDQELTKVVQITINGADAEAIAQLAENLVAFEEQLSHTTSEVQGKNLPQVASGKQLLEFFAATQEEIGTFASKTGVYIHVAREGLDHLNVEQATAAGTFKNVADLFSAHKARMAELRQEHKATAPEIKAGDTVGQYMLAQAQGYAIGLDSVAIAVSVNRMSKANKQPWVKFAKELPCVPADDASKDEQEGPKPE